MSGYVLPPGGGRSFGPGISVKVEHGVSPSFACLRKCRPAAMAGSGTASAPGVRRGGLRPRRHGRVHAGRSGARLATGSQRSGAVCVPACGGRSLSPAVGHVGGGPTRPVITAGAETLVVARMAGKSPWALRVAIHRGLHQLAASADWGWNATNGPGVFTVRCLGFPFPAG